MVIHAFSCSFCGRPNADVRKLIVNEHDGCAICERCVLNCLEILASDSSTDSVRKARWEEFARELSKCLDIPLKILDR